MDILQKSYELLFSGKEYKYKGSVKYSGKFSAYNANIKLCRDKLELSLSKKWKGVDEAIVIGLVQSLLLKILKKKGSKTKKDTINIDLYNGFVKNLHISIPKDKIDPLLQQSFERVNEYYFYGIVEIPNLIWGAYSRAQLGTYNYKTDTITISKVFEKCVENSEDMKFLDYVMYHEILHKKHKFSCKNGRNRYHDSRFRKAEKEFSSEEIEKEMRHFLRRQRKPRKKTELRTTLFNFFRKF